MILLLLAFLFPISFAHASLCNGNETAIHLLDTSDCPSSNTRTLWEILWGCLATLIACTWTAIHPDISDIYEDQISICFHRLSIMLATMVAPEFVIIRAARQYFSARKTAYDFNEISSARGIKEWTLTHGFFAGMGGFVLYVNGGPQATLTPGELRRFVEEGSVDTPVITEADIQGRSNGDMFSKVIAALQLAWFIVQLAARFVQKLPITPAEVDTLALVALICIIYGFWWKKPKGVRRPCPVYWKAASFSAKDLRYHRKTPFKDWILSLGGYAHPHGTSIFITGCISGIIFGGIQFLAWYVLFPGPRLWRVASSVIVLTPTFVLITFMILDMGCFPDVGCCLTIQPYLVTMAVAITVVAYSAARILLALHMLLSMQSLLPGMYDTVAWTKFIPHF